MMVKSMEGLPVERLQAAIETACLLEATARKPGNVHPQASFPDLTYSDFVRSASAAAPALAAARVLGVGPAVLEAVTATRQQVAANTNLGIILLLAPLAAVAPNQSLASGIPDVLGRLTVEDAASVYAAIRAARPGGLGKVDEQDVAGAPTETLRDVMRLAADRDLIARQYVTDFRLVLESGLGHLAACADFERDWEESIIGLQLRLMAGHPDSLIARKCGVQLAEEASRRASDMLAAGWPQTPAAHRLLGEFDTWLRADGHRRNPGTTADLIAASLFAALREGVIRAPVSAWS